MDSGLILIEFESGISKAFIDTNIGVNGRKIHWMRSEGDEEFWCRMVIAIMGNYNCSEEYLKKTSPFDPNFRDNFIEGKGKTREEALEIMYKEMEDISNMLWAE